MRRIRASACLIAFVAGSIGMVVQTPLQARATTNCTDPASPAAPAIHVALNGSPATVTSTMNYKGFICPDQLAPAGTAVLDLTATLPQGTTGDFFLCLDGIPDTSDLTATARVRDSHLTGSVTERVAIQSPLRNPEYRFRVRAVGVGALTAFGCTGATLGPALPFTLTVSYHSLAAGAASNGFAFATQHLPVAQPTQSTPGSGEPSLVVDRLHGDRVYVSGPVGVPAGLGCTLNLTTAGCNGVNLWFSGPGAQGFQYCNSSQPNGGGDSTLAVDTTGSLYSADLAATDVDTQKYSSTSAGPPALTPGASCGSAANGVTAAQSDRQWFATYLPDPSKGTGSAKVFLSYHGFVDSLPYECSSLDGGATFLPAPCAPMITDPAIAADAAGNTINGNQVFDSKGTIHSIFGTSTAAENVATGGNGPIHKLYVASSADGLAFTDNAVFAAPTGRSLANIFPVIAIDHKDNLYAAWTDQPVGGGAANVKFTSSTDLGKTWSAPVTVNSPDLKSNVLPWLVAGDDGRVDVVWVGSTAPKPNDVTADWNIYMAQTVNGHSGATFTQTRVSPQPVRHGWLCFQGLGCATGGDDGRILLDFINVDIDSHCLANIAYGNSGPDTSRYPDPANSSGTSGFNPFTDYARQTAGSSLCVAAASTAVQAPASPPVPALPLTSTAHLSGLSAGVGLVGAAAVLVLSGVALALVVVSLRRRST